MDKKRHIFTKEEKQNHLDAIMTADGFAFDKSQYHITGTGIYSRPATLEEINEYNNKHRHFKQMEEQARERLDWNAGYNAISTIKTQRANIIKEINNNEREPATRYYNIIRCFVRYHHTINTISSFLFNLESGGIVDYDFLSNNWINQIIPTNLKDLYYNPFFNEQIKNPNAEFLDFDKLESGKQNLFKHILSNFDYAELDKELKEFAEDEASKEILYKQLDAIAAIIRDNRKDIVNVSDAEFRKIGTALTSIETAATKLAKTIFGNDTTYTAEEYQTINIAADGKEPINIRFKAYIMLVDKNNGKTTKETIKLTPQDKRVLSIVSTLYKLNERGEFNINAIVNYYSYNTPDNRVKINTTDGIYQTVDNCLFRLGTAWIELDRDDYKKITGVHLTNSQYIGHLLDFKRVRLRYSNGTEADGIKVLSPPILAEDSNIRRQIWTQKQYALLGRASDTKIMTRQYIDDFISDYKYRKETEKINNICQIYLNKVIEYLENIYRKEYTKTEISRISDFIIATLEQLKKCEEIKDDYASYRETKTGKINIFYIAFNNDDLQTLEKIKRLEQKQPKAKKDNKPKKK